MTRRYSAADDVFFESTVKRFTSDGKIDWGMVVPEVSEEAGKPQTLGAVKMRYRRLMFQNKIEQSSRSGNKTWERMKKFVDNLLDSNQRQRAQLDAKKEKRRSSARTELLEKKNRELREENKSLKKELKSHGPILKWYIQAQEGFKVAKKALINE